MSTQEQSNRSVSILAIGNYNFKQGAKVNPYLGCGIGVSLCEPLVDVVYYHNSAHFCIQPRVGVELFRHFRVGASMLINTKGYNNVGINIGVVIGGRPKK